MTDFTGGSGNDVFNGGIGNDSAQGSGGDDHFNGNGGNDFLSGDEDNDTLNGGDDNDSLYGGAGIDHLNGGAGDDIILYQNPGDFVTGETIDGGTGFDVVRFDGNFVNTSVDFSSTSLVGIEGIDAGIRLSIALLTAAQLDALTAVAGNFQLTTGGFVSLAGVRSASSFGQTLALAFGLSDAGNVLDMTGFGNRFTNVFGGAAGDTVIGDSAFDNIYGMGGDDTITGGGGDDRFVGGAGADDISGGDGDDTFVIDAAGDLVAEDQMDGGAGFDILQVDAGGQITDLTVVDLSGIDGIEVRSGNAFISLGQFDTVAGIAGTFTFSDAGNASLDGVTALDFGLTVFHLADGTNRFDFANWQQAGEVIGGSGADTIIGSVGFNWLVGNDGNDVLDGRGGQDWLDGGLGSDTYFVDDLSDLVMESASGGRDKVYSRIGLTLSIEVEDLTLQAIAGAAAGTGNASNNVITGNDASNSLLGLDGADILIGNGGDDVLDGGLHADLMVGGDGNDTYMVDDAGDRATESSAAGGIDIVLSAVSFALSTNLEKLLLVGSVAIDGAGNGLANDIEGNAAANTLDGGSGADVLRGGGGNDTYIVDNAGDQVVEISGAGGTDTVRSALSYALGTNVENLVLTGTGALSGIGNGFANDMAGNEAGNALDGRAGADTLRGGAGNDSYFVDNAGDRVVEFAGEGRDKVYAATSFTLDAHIEDLTLQAVAKGSTGTGNDLANVLGGNDFNNVLRGLNGDDTLMGAAGNDTLQGGFGRDTMQGGADADTFWFTTALAGGNVDRILDFEVGVDEIILENSVFAGLAGGSLAPGAFVTGAAAADADDRIIYNSATGALLFDADGIGGAAAVQFATLQTGLALSASDFTVI